MRTVRNLALAVALVVGGMYTADLHANPPPPCETGCFPNDGTYCDAGHTSWGYCEIVCPNYCNCGGPAWSYCYDEGGAGFFCGCISM